MLAKEELATAVLVGLVGFAIAPRVGGTAIVYVGLLGGLAAVGSPTYATAVIRGGRAGTLGGLLVVCLAGLMAAFRIVPLLGVPFAVDAFLFTGFSMMLLIVPMYGIEGLVVAPLVQWIGEKVATRGNGRPTTGQ